MTGWTRGGTLRYARVIAFGEHAMATRHSRASLPPQSGAGATPPVLLSGGNPQIAKGDGDEPVQAYIAAMPGWKSAAGKRLDALIERTVPGVRKAVKWNSPLYGAGDTGWFLGLHCFNRYIKVAFFQGASLQPPPPVASKGDDTRYFHIHEDDFLDEEALADWIRQAAALPGRMP
ncbi:hypothetical protein GCM10007387_17950 [Pseudoduganella albidiflava]|uniref:YdhG-like domain-containing protein n=2 Tax=Pseudoduganella albidiflava TaxID=321983 RepID=A0AA88C236_9BURK|nr:hypothetical protein GCM10007387_17950 [Pseudoduganella albidiflava]